jgi:hypothetical protein
MISFEKMKIAIKREYFVILRSYFVMTIKLVKNINGIFSLFIQNFLQLLQT